MKARANKLSLIHPGEILREEFMLPRGLSQNALARALNVPPCRINEIVLEKRGQSALLPNDGLQFRARLGRAGSAADLRGIVFRKVGSTVGTKTWQSTG